MIKRKQRKGQIVFLETILVLCIYLFLFGFLIDGMQMFYTKIALSMTAYTGVHIATAYETDMDKVDNDYNYAGSDRLSGHYKSNEAIEEAIAFYNSIKLRKNDDSEKVTITIDIPDNNAVSDDLVYFRCKAQCAVRYMFPLISPTFIFDGKPLAQGINLEQEFYMPRERIYD